MAIIMEATGEIIPTLDLVTTPAELLDTFPTLSRGALRNAMLADKFEWVQIRRTIIIDRDTFLDWWSSRDPRGLDMWFIAK